MKIYSIIVTVIAVVLVIIVGYFYSQMNVVSRQAAFLQKDNELCQTDKTKLEGRITEAVNRAENLQKESAVLSSASSSFMIPGDLKALTVGSREATEVEQNIAGITDKMERMGIEKDWTDFKTTLKLNAILGLMRNLAQSLDRNLSPQPGPKNQLPTRQPIQ